jgi:acetyl-CoA/propionyl-CoA carboxylase biotin carboxyl carrier protein
VNEPAFIGADGKFGVYTRWIETEWNNDIPAYVAEGSEGEEAGERQSVVVEVGGKRIEVSLPASLFSGVAAAPAAAAAGASKRKKSAGVAGTGGNSNAIKAPMQATVVKIAVEVGQEVNEGDQVVVLEAMKMEQPLNAHKSGKVKSIGATVGETVPAGTVLIEFE